MIVGAVRITEQSEIATSLPVNIDPPTRASAGAIFRDRVAIAEEAERPAQWRHFHRWPARRSRRSIRPTPMTHTAGRTPGIYNTSVLADLQWVLRDSS